jgi:hypothetical protein
MAKRLRFKTEEALLLCRHLSKHAGFESFYETLMFPADQLDQAILNGIKNYDSFNDLQDDERNRYIYQNLHKRSDIHKLKHEELESINQYRHLLGNTTITKYRDMIINPKFFEGHNDIDTIPARDFHFAISEGNACPLTKEDTDNILIYFLRLQMGSLDPRLH